MSAKAFVRARIDERVKEQAEQVLEELGLTVSDVIRITLTRVAKEGGLPLELKVPNAETREAMRGARELMNKRAERFGTADDLIDDLERNTGWP